VEKVVKVPVVKVLENNIKKKFFTTDSGKGGRSTSGKGVGETGSRRKSCRCRTHR